MLAKLTRQNRVTLPKTVLQAVGPTEYFDVMVRDDQIILSPVRLQRANAVREKLAELGIAANDVHAALAWVRAPR